jgi:hypothetical protein
VLSHPLSVDTQGAVTIFGGVDRKISVPPTENSTTSNARSSRG